MENKLKKIEKLYLDGKLFSETDKKATGGYWDLSGELASLLVPNEKVANMSPHELSTLLKIGFYQVFQDVLVLSKKKYGN